MSNLNKALLIGRLTKDPEMRYTPSGTAVTNFSIATNRWSTGPDGEKKAPWFTWRDASRPVPGKGRMARSGA
jgi:single-strand DNA-binding protein